VTQSDSGAALLGIGARLRAARERAGLTLIQAAEQLRLDPRLVGAMEEELFEMLGGAVYVRGHLRRYAELVGESAADIPGRYAASAQWLQPVPPSTYKERRPRNARAALMPLVIVAAVALFALLLWWVLGATRRHHAAPAAVATPAAAASPAAPGIPAQPLNIALALQPGPAAGGAAHTAEPAASGNAAHRANSLRLRLHFAADSWTEVYDAQGKRLFYELGAADSTRTLSGMAPLKVVLGHAPGVAVEVDGQSVAIPARALRADSAQFIISPSGRLTASR
jgi:cytoskeleton protein RodZ